MAVTDQAGSPGWLLDAVGRVAERFHAVYRVYAYVCMHMCIRVCQCVLSV